MNEDHVFIQRYQNLQRHPLCQCLEYCYLITGLWTILLNFPRTLQHISIGSTGYYLISRPIRSPVAQKNMQTTEFHTTQKAHRHLCKLNKGGFPRTTECTMQNSNAQLKTYHWITVCILIPNPQHFYSEHLWHRMTCWMTTHWLTASNHPRVLRTINHRYRQRCLSRQSGTITSAWRPSSILNVHNCTSQELALQNNNGSHNV